MSRFSAKDRATVDAFYKAAIAAGGRDNGAPGIRAHYHANYYGAFVLDPDGHNIEAVCHTPALSSALCGKEHRRIRSLIRSGMPIEPPRDSTGNAGHPNRTAARNSTRQSCPEIPPPVHEPGEPPRPDELPGKMPDELPVRGPPGPTAPPPATDG